VAPPLAVGTRGSVSGRVSVAAPAVDFNLDDVGEQQQCEWEQQREQQRQRQQQQQQWERL
jgi:hypothetical protein